MKKVLKKIANKFFSIIGLVVINKQFYIPSNIIDLRGVALSPADLIPVFSKYNINFLININAAKIMESPLLKIWVETLILREKEGENEALNKRESFLHLKNYFSINQPKNVSELIGFGLEEANEHNIDYFKSHPLCAVYPWDDKHPKTCHYFAIANMKTEFELNGGGTYQKEDGWKAFGPSSERLITVEYNRLVKVFDSIKENGYKEGMGFPSATIYLNEDNYLLELQGAWHRTAAMLALNYEFIPVIVSKLSTKVIKRNELKLWHQVKERLYTENQALSLFDKVFLPFNNPAKLNKCSEELKIN